MNSITHRQINIDLFPHGNAFHFQYYGKNYVLPSKNKLHAFFQKQPFDTVKLCQKGKESYVHFDLDDIEVFDSKWTLRKNLSQESCGAWIEEKDGKKRYFVDDSGWFNTSFKQVSKEEYLHKMDSPSTMQKVLGIGLGILALLPGALEIKEQLPLGASETGMGLLALQQRSPLLGALGYSFLPSSAMAQATGLEFQINNYTASSPQSPATAVLNNSSFVVTWENSGQDGDSNGIFAQRYDASGALLGSEFQVNSYTTNSQSDPTIAPLNDGGFVIAWHSVAQGQSGTSIFAQRYDANGAPFGSEFQVNSYTTGNQQFPAIAPLNDGGFVVAWRSNGQDSSNYGVFAQMYVASGALLGSEFQVNNYTTGSQRDPAIKSLSDDSFVVAWYSNGQDGNGYGIFAQRYLASGALLGSEFQVNNYTTNDQEYPAIAPLNDGSFVIAWHSFGQDGDFDGIFAQRYDASGALLGSEFQVNNYSTSSQRFPVVTGLNDGGFVVAWQSNGQDGSIYGIFAQRYDASGALSGSEFQVNSYTANDQKDPSIASLNDGGFVISWASLGQDGSGYGIFGQRYDQGGNPVPLTYVPPMSSASAPSSQLSPTSSSTSENNIQSSNPISSMPSPSTNASQTTELVTIPSSQVGSSASQTTHQPGSPSPSGSQIPLLIEVVYGEVYSFQQNGQTIGTFTISGGSGLYSGGNSNTLTIEIDPDFVLQDGVTITLFSVPDGEEPQWEGVTFLNSDDCFNAEGELVESEENNGLDYQVIFGYQGESCSYNVGVEKFKTIPALLGGNLI